MQDDAPKKEKRPRPSRFQQRHCRRARPQHHGPPRATSRPAVSAWRALAGLASAGGLKPPPCVHASQLGRLRRYVGHHGCRYRCPGGKDGAAGNWCEQLVARWRPSE